MKKNAKSAIWKFFEIYSDKHLKHLAHCKICNEDINYTLTMSTGMLTRHLSRKHREEYAEMLEQDALSKVQASSCSMISSLDVAVKVQSSIESYVKFGPAFEMKLLDWIIQTYQPLHVCEHPSFQRNVPFSKYEGTGSWCGKTSKFAFNGSSSNEDKAEKHSERSPS